MSRPPRHRRSLRLSGYDYSQANAYLTTICVAQKKFLFGNIKEGTMRLSAAGQIVVDEWLKNADLRPCVTLDQFIVMPNHFHGILWIDNEPGGTARCAPTVQRFGQAVSGSLPAIMRAFKGAVTKRINLLGGGSGAPVWQRGYYEHVIRNDASLQRIREYIQNNPLSWELDRENPGRRGEDAFYCWMDGFTSHPDPNENRP
jgi:putative transposase